MDSNPSTTGTTGTTRTTSTASDTSDTSTASTASTPTHQSTIDADSVPTSFGVFKPVGHLMVGVPTQAQVDGLEAALHAAGWPTDALQHFIPRESVPELAAMVDNAGAMAGFGYEITLLRRYLALAEQGYRWLLVKVSDSEHAASAAETARVHGAVLAVYYRRFTVEDLI